MWNVALWHTLIAQEKKISELWTLDNIHGLSKEPKLIVINYELLGELLGHQLLRIVQSLSEAPPWNRPAFG
jgi:hypothetical protein